MTPLTCNIEMRQPGQKTVLVTGIPRGGTSVTCAVIDGLGVRMKEQDAVGDGHFETPLFKNDPTKPEHWAAMMDRAAQMKEQYGWWGFKAAANPDVLERFAKALPNVHLVIVFRDFAAMVQAHEAQRVQERKGEELRTWLLEEVVSLESLSRNTFAPTIAISLERMRTTPGLVVEHLCEFLGYIPGPDAVEDAIARVNTTDGGYLMKPCDQ
jgi:hypothetical protein